MKFVIILLTVLLAAACDVNASKFGTDEAQDMAEKLTYIKDHRTDLCFALIASRVTGSTDQTGMGMTEVPCENVEHLIVNK